MAFHRTQGARPVGGARGRLPAVLVLLLAVVARIALADETPADGAPTDASASAETVDFHRDVEPIFRARCHACHSAENSTGGFRLDDRESARRGGDDGRTFLGQPLAANLLYERVVSNDPQHRMPLGEAPLKPEERDVLRRWIEAGTPWPDAQVARGEDAGFWARLNPLFDFYDAWYPRQKFVAWGFLALQVVTLVVVRLRRVATAASTAPVRWRAGRAVVQRLGPAAYLICILGLVVAGYQNVLHKAWEDRSTAEQEVAMLQQKLHPTRPAGGWPVAERPQHPKRLSGTYYRGNDERNPRLFNGGFYRTATVEVALCDGEGEPLNYGDAVQDGLQIHLAIEKARLAAETLFTEEIWKGVFLSATRLTAAQALPAMNDFVPFTATLPGQRWEARWPLGAFDDPITGTLQGEAYLYKGDAAVLGKGAYPHFGVYYELHLSDGRLTQDSEVWMGSLYQLGSLVDVPQGKLTLSEWFDFREIPQIEAPNPDDPVLLGVPEHQGAPGAAPPAVAPDE